MFYHSGREVSPIAKCKELSFTEPYLARSRDKDSKYNTIISEKDSGKIISNENK